MRIYFYCCLYLCITRAQATNVIFDRITMDSGLSSSSVTSILKDRTGYVWVGTTEGLNRYDGYTFKVFLPVPDCQESIQSSLSINYSRIQMEVSGSFFPRVGLAVMTEFGYISEFHERMASTTVTCVW